MQEQILLRVLACPRAAGPTKFERFCGKVVLVDVTSDAPTAAIVSTIRGTAQAGDAKREQGYVSAVFHLVPDISASLRVPAAGDALLEFVTATGPVRNPGIETLNLGRVRRGPLPADADGFDFSMKVSDKIGVRAFHWRAPKRSGYLRVSIARP